jgi:hypothetical protein
MSLHVEVYKVVFPMSVSECFLGTKKQPWLAEQNCSLNPRDTFSPEGLNILTLVVGLYKEQLCASGIPGCSPNRAVRERMPEVWPHCLLKSILSVASGGYRECSPSFYRVGKPKLRWGVGGGQEGRARTQITACGFCSFSPLPSSPFPACLRVLWVG